VREDQVWKDGGRAEVVGERRGPQYVHDEGLCILKGGDGVVAIVGTVGVGGAALSGEVMGKYGRNAREPYCGSESMGEVRPSSV
jgi:hypothetical protein